MAISDRLVFALSTCPEWKVALDPDAEAKCLSCHGRIGEPIPQDRFL